MSDDFDTLKPFCELSAAGKALLSQGCVRATCRPPRAVLFKGDKVSGAYFVLSGRLRVYSLAADGTEATLYFIDPGETCVFALNSLFNDLRYPAWVQAETETQIMLIPGPLFRRLFEKESVIQDITVRALSTLVFRLMNELEEIHAYRLDQRLANLLLIHADNDGSLRMTQQQMARHLGTSREVVARLISQLAAQGHVATGRGVVSILDAKALADRLTRLD